jgi:hypothetical protein
MGYIRRIKIYKKNFLINLAIADHSFIFMHGGKVRFQWVILENQDIQKNVLRNLAIADLCMVTLNCISSFIFMQDG